MKKDITPQFATCIQALRARMDVTRRTTQYIGRSTRFWSRMDEFKDVSREVVGDAALNNVPRELNKRFFVQIFCFINVQMFNARSYSDESAVRFRMVSTEKWVFLFWMAGLASLKPPSCRR